MRAISLWQPWASLIMTGAKTFETRSWLTNYRGPLVICAAKGGMTKGEEFDMIESKWFSSAWEFQGALAPLVGKPLDLDMKMYGCNGRGWPGVKIADLPRGKALGIVDLVDCRRTDDLTQGDFAKEKSFGNYDLGRFAWKLENVRPFVVPFPVVGRQGFFQVEIPGQ